MSVGVDTTYFSHIVFNIQFMKVMRVLIHCRMSTIYVRVSQTPMMAFIKLTSCSSLEIYFHFIFYEMCVSDFCGFLTLDMPICVCVCIKRLFSVLHEH